MAESLFHLLKLASIVVVCGVFMVAITVFLNFIGTIIFGGFITEFFSLISMYLPFNASAVFGSIATAITGIFAFLIAKKIFDLTSWSISAV